MIRDPCRENCSGSWRNARSCTVTTIGTSVAHGISVVEWATSTSPVTASTFGQFTRVHTS